MDRLASVLLKVRPSQFNGSHAAVGQHDLDTTALDHGDLVLTDLIRLWQVGVEVVFPRKDRDRRDLPTHSQAKPNGSHHRRPIRHGQHAWQGQVHHVCLTIWRCPKCGRSG